MRLRALVETCDAVAGTRSRLEKTKLLAELLAALGGHEVASCVAFLVGELRQGRVGLGHAAVRDVEPADSAGAPPLELVDVDRAFDEIAATTGAGSKARRLEILATLLGRASEAERGFLRRLIVGELRQGALEGVLVEAVARASGIPASDVRRAAMLGGSLRDVAVAALSGGAEAVAAFRLELLRPVQPMLAQAAASPAEAIEKLGRAAFEWKLDGARVQLHRCGDDVRVFTRKGGDVTGSVPEVVELARALPVRELVLDGEVLALRPDG